MQVTGDLLHPPQQPSQSERTRHWKVIARSSGTFFAVLLTALLLALRELFEVSALWTAVAIVSAVPPAFVLAYSARGRSIVAWCRLDRIFPLIGYLISEQNRRESIESVVDGYEDTLSHFDLWEYCDGPDASNVVCGQDGASRALTTEFRKDLVASVSPQEMPERWSETIARGLANQCTKLPAAVLLVLYQERRATVESGSWRALETDRDAWGVFLEVLSRSPLLPSPEALFQYGAEHLERLTNRIRPFRLDAVSQDLHRLSHLADRANDYLSFLCKHDVASRPVPLPDLGRVLDLVEESLGGAGWHDLSRNQWLATVTPHLLSELGRDRIREVVTEPEPLIKRYADLSVAIFLVRQYPEDRLAAEAICRTLSRDTSSVELAWAFLDLKEDLRSEHKLSGKQYLTLRLLIDSWRAKLEETRDWEDRPKEIATLQESLQQGEWLIRLSDLLELAHGASFRRPQGTPQAGRPEPGSPPSRQDDATRCVGLDEKPELLRKLFLRLELNTIERYLETRSVTPYLLTFGTAGGPLSQLVDCLTSREKLKRAHVETLELDGRPKYNLHPYTDNTRIGLVPEGWTFKRFYEEFQEDFGKILASRQTLVPGYDWETSDLQGSEVLLHRFGLSGRDFYPFRSDFSRGQAIERIKEVLADELRADELVTLIQYEGKTDVEHQVVHGLITDVIGSTLSLSGAERRDLDEHDNAVRVTFLRELGCGGEEELARVIADMSAEQRATVADRIAGAIEEQVTRFNHRRASEIARAYVAALHGLGGTT